MCNASPVAHIGEARVAVIVKQHFVVVAEIGDKEIHQAVVLIVPGGNSHRGNLASVLVQGKSRNVALIVEGPVPFIYVEKVGFRVVANHEIRLAVPFERYKDR